MAPQRSPYIDALGLEPHPEGGWWTSLYTSPVTLPHPEGRGPRASATLIHYLLHPGERSRWHAVASDELWLWHRGGPLLLRIAPPGPAPTAATPPPGTVDHLLGPEPGLGQRFEALVPAHHWQTAEPAGDEPVLVSCLVTPGFDFADFTMPDEPPSS